MKFNFSPFSRLKESWDYRGEPENIHFLGEVFWRGLLALALIVVLVAVGVGVQEMAAVSEAENVSGAPSTAPPPLDPAKLQNALAQFSARQAQYQAILQSPAPQVADPSK